MPSPIKKPASAGFFMGITDQTPRTLKLSASAFFIVFIATKAETQSLWSRQTPAFAGMTASSGSHVYESFFMKPDKYAVSLDFWR